MVGGVEGVERAKQPFQTSGLLPQHGSRKLGENSRTQRQPLKTKKTLLQIIVSLSPICWDCKGESRLTELERVEELDSGNSTESVASVMKAQA